MQFVEFDEKTGSIISITNKFNKDKLSVEIDKSIADGFIKGTEQTSQWKVLPDKTNVRKYKVVKIVKNTNEEFLNKNVFPIKQFKEIQKEKNVFQIIQRESSWFGYADIDQDTANFYTSRDGYFGHEKIVYVTEHNDSRKYLGKFDIDFTKFFQGSEFIIDFNNSECCDLYIASGNDEFVYVREQ